MFSMAFTIVNTVRGDGNFRKRGLGLIVAPCDGANHDAR